MADFFYEFGKIPVRRRNELNFLVLGRALLITIYQTSIPAQAV